jgi:hypothetical protein
MIMQNGYQKRRKMSIYLHVVNVFHYCAKVPSSAADLVGAGEVSDEDDSTADEMIVSVSTNHDDDQNNSHLRHIRSLLPHTPTLREEEEGRRRC